MKDNKVYITWSEVFERLEEFENSLSPGDLVYGVPKGGMILSGFLRHHSQITNPKNANIILDDIYDSGRTGQYYMDLGVDKFQALFNKSEFPGKWVVFPWEAAHPAGEETVEQNIVRILQYLGEDSTREGLKDTPARVVRSWKEIYGGYNQEQEIESLFTVFETGTYDQMVVLKEIEFQSNCEHHMLPFYGKAHVAYIPNEKVIGISKLARLVDLYSRRLQIQERICEQVTSALMQYLNPKGAACVIQATHMCMTMRGVKKQHSVMTTSSLKGVFLEKPAVRAEFMNLI